MKSQTFLPEDIDEMAEDASIAPTASAGRVRTVGFCQIWRSCAKVSAPGESSILLLIYLSCFSYLIMGSVSPKFLAV